MDSYTHAVSFEVSREKRAFPAAAIRFLCRVPKLLILLLFLGNTGATAQTDLLVYSHGTLRINRYDGETGTYINKLSKPSGAGDLFGMALGPDGYLYVVYAAGDRLYRYDPSNGQVLDTIASGGLLNHPVRLAFGPDGLLYISNRASNSIVRCNVQTGAVEPFVSSGSGGLAWPRGLVFGPDGNLYVASWSNDNVLRFDGTTGAFVDEFVQTGSGGVDIPRGLHFGQDGNLYVCSYGTNEVLRYDGTTGSFIDVAIASGEGGLSGSIWIDNGPDGKLYVCSVNTSEILRFEPNGGPFIDTFVSRGSGGLSAPAGLLFVSANPLPPTPTPAPANGAPSVPTVWIEPEDPKTLDDLVCLAEGSIDPEGEPVSYRYRWFRDDVELTGETSFELGHENTSRYQTLRCVVTPSDGILEGPSGEDSVVIANSPPTPPVIKILPEKPRAWTGLAVWIVTESLDPDGDDIVYLYEWFESPDGINWTRRPEVSGNLPFSVGQPEISSLYTQVAEYWRVHVTPVEEHTIAKNASEKGVETVVGEAASNQVLIRSDLTPEDATDGVGSADLLVLLSVWGETKGTIAPELEGLFFGPDQGDGSEVEFRHLLQLGVLGWRQ